MILRELRIEGFGKLKGEVHFAADRINLLVGPNEAGKSTLAAAIAAALYGLDEDRRSYRGRLTPREQYEPWDGSPYAVELRFEAQGKTYIVNRHFGRGTVTVFAEGEGDVSESFRLGPGLYPVGEMLLELNVDQFVRSALWLQPGPGRLSGSEVCPDESLTALLERQATTGTGDASAQAAVEVLEQALRHYSLGDTRLLVTNQIKRLDERAARLRGELALEEGRLERAGLALGELQALRRRRSAFEEDRKRAAAYLSVLALRESEAMLDRDRAAREQWEARRKERAELALLPGLDPRDAESVRRAQFEKEAAERESERLAEKRRTEWTEPLAEWERDQEANRTFEWAVPVNATEIAELAGNWTRLEGLRAGADEKLRSLHAELEAAGISMERLEALQSRFEALSSRDNQLLTQYPASAQATATAREEAEREVAGAEAGMREIAGERNRRRLIGAVLVVAGLGAASGSVWFALGAQPALSVAGLVITLAALAAGAGLLYRAAAHRAPERQLRLRELMTARRHLQELREQGAERELALNELARRLGYPGGEGVLREYADYQQLVRETERLSWVRQEIERMNGEETRLREQAWAWAKRAGLASSAPSPPREWRPDETLGALAAGVAARIRLRSRREALEVTRRRLEEEEAELTERVESALAAARAVVRALGMAEDDWERALAELETRRQARERLEALEKLLPELEKQTASEADLRAAREELDRLRGEVWLIRAAQPQWLEVPAEIASRAEAARRRAQAERALEESSADLIRLEREVGYLDKQSTGPATSLRVELVGIERERRRAEQFQAAVQLAIDTWRSVARETHAVWSEFISRRVNELLPALGPQYRGFAVADDLEYSLVVEGQRLPRESLEQVLSAGTLDQLRLAVRLAICEFLSRGDKPVPIVLDDPFATADDERAEAGLRFLADAAVPRHQVLVFTCHRERLVALAARRPEWFEEKVHRIDLPLDPMAVPAAAVTPWTSESGHGEDGGDEDGAAASARLSGGV